MIKVKPKKSFYLLLIASAFVAALSLFALHGHDSSRPGEHPATHTDVYQIISRPCWFQFPQEKAIECGELRTPVSSGAFSLPFVVIRDDSSDHQPDPVIYLRGGPGESMELNTDGIEYWLNWLSYTELSRDLILLEPRGVGLSKPALTCAAFDKFSLSVVARDTKLEDELAKGYQILTECFENLGVAQHPFDVNHYGTALHAQDLQALMSLLGSSQKPGPQKNGAQRNSSQEDGSQGGFPQWNLVGVSYGTRVAIEVANRSDKVRSLILDSVYPAGQGGVQTFSAVLDNAFINFFNWCSTTPECAMDKPVQEKLFSALEELKKRPIAMTVSRYDGELPVELLLNDHRFVSVIFSALYSRHQWPKIPRVIEAAIARDVQGLLPLVKPFISNAFAKDFSILAFLAVDCRDHRISSEADYQQALKSYPLLADYTRDLWRYQACHFLMKEPSTQRLKTASPQVPALILAGDLDPITPVEWAEELRQAWPEAQLKIFKDTGHAVINSHDCAFQLLREFLDNPREPVTGCGSSNTSD